MHLSKNQLSRFWRDWSAIARLNHWTHAESETERRSLLQRAGFSSLTMVDKLSGFSRLLEELAILRNDLTALRRAEQNPRRVLLHTLRTYAQQLGPIDDPSSPLGSPYLAAYMRDRWHHTDLDRLTDPDLEQLRYTLADRLTQAHRSSTQARRRTAARHRPPPARQVFCLPDAPVHSNCPF